MYMKCFKCDVICITAWSWFIPEDRPLVGMKWNGHFYLGPTLPFSLRSAPKHFQRHLGCSRMASERGELRNVLHYLDDFAVLGAPGTGECYSALGEAQI